MKLRFEVDQAECFRRGVDCPKSIVTVEVDPAKLKQADRDLIAYRHKGIDIVHVTILESGRGRVKVRENNAAVRLKANLPTFESLMEAVRDDEEWCKARELECANHKALADVGRAVRAGRITMAQRLS